MRRSTPRVALVFPRMATGEMGGAEVLRSELHAALVRSGVAAELVEVTCDEQDFSSVLRSYSRCYDLNLDEFDLVVSTKAPTFMVRHRNHVSLLVHTLRVFYDRFGSEFPRATPELLAQRERIHRMDLEAFSDRLVRRRFVIGECVWRRLVDVDARWRDLPFDEITLPPRMLPQDPSPRGEHFLLPGRLHRWKRVDLAIRAVRAMNGNMPLHITGTGEDEAMLREVAAGDPRIVFHGRVSDDELDELFRGSLAVPFVPVDEDFGFITVEAFAHGIPVVTCTDSGRPAAIVEESGGGLVVEPEVHALAAAMEALRSDPARARELGRRGRELAESLTWDGLARTLLEAGGIRAAGADDVERPGEEPAAARDPLTLAVIDNQPIEPPVGGGRLRLYGLYRTLDEDTRAVYVGSYDWRGPERRVLRHPPQLEERTIPHSPEHFAAAEALQEKCGGQSVIDVSQPILAHLSAEYLDECRRALGEAQVAVFSHPWLYPPLADDVRRLGLPLVYDSQNMEWKLRRGLLAGTAMGRALAESVRFWEGALCRNADLVLACSEDDAAGFVEEYGIGRGRIEIVPNGVDVRAISPPDGAMRTDARRAMKIAGDAFAAVFIGSAYGPNVDAARWIVEELAPACTGTEFLIVGGVGSTIPRGRRPGNVRVTGEVDDAGRLGSFHAADLAINPIPFGSGTNIKMFDFMAAGLPIVSSPSGARGLGEPEPPAFVVREPQNFAAEIAALREDPERRRALGIAARKLACARYDWEKISARVATLTRELVRHRSGGARRVGRAAPRGPAVSVVVPSYARPDNLRALVNRLAEQTVRGFEILVIEQGERKTELEAPPGLTLRHVFTPVRGAVRARNTGLRIAEAEIVAFTDDDCLPDAGWLEAVLETIHRPGTVGVEGLVAPDRPDADPRTSRIVSNQGFEGVGFMTANLAVHRRAALEIGGFDEIFDHPHFREDTDLAWRLSARGAIPFSSEARVVHPVLPRSDPRESAEARTRFFEKDPLLFEKHPARYVGLFLAEDHYRRTPGFWDAFRRGVEKYDPRLEVARLAESDLVDRDALPGWLLERAER